MKKNKIFALAMALMMCLTMVVPSSAKIHDEKLLAKTASFILRYDVYRDLGEQEFQSYIQEELAHWVYRGNSEVEITPLAQSIIDQNVETFITVYDKLMEETTIKVSEKVRFLADTLDQFEYVEVKHNYREF